MLPVFSANRLATLHKTCAQDREVGPGCQSALAQCQMIDFVGSDATVSFLRLIYAVTYGIITNPGGESLL